MRQSNRIFCYSCSITIKRELPLFLFSFTCTSVRVQNINFHSLKKVPAKLLSLLFFFGLPAVYNLLNNAFHKVNQKQKTAASDYKPEVTASTFAEYNSIVIEAKDNGNGIPDTIKDKIMQPFFTTKPIGEGTGSGLSLSYDVVLKAMKAPLMLTAKRASLQNLVFNYRYKNRI